jgi:hypothetical protein
VVDTAYRTCSIYQHVSACIIVAVLVGVIVGNAVRCLSPAWTLQRELLLASACTRFRPIGGVPESGR